MTNIPNTIPEIAFPTEWHLIDDVRRTECRQLSLDTYELRSPAYTLIIPKEGFDLYRDGSLEGELKFEQWCEDRDIFPTPRPDRRVTDG